MRRLLLFLLTLLLAVPAGALILDSGDGQGNTTPPADDPGWSHVGRVGGPAGIYLGNGWVLTANHVILSNPEFQSVIYPIVPGSVVQLQNPDTSPADLKIFRIDPSPNLGLLRIRASTPSVNTALTYVSRGIARGAATSWMGVGGYLWGSNSTMRWGTNKLAATGNANGTLAFSSTFTEIPGGGSTTNEAMGADGDSGGAVFIKNGVNWELAGVLIAVGSYVGQPPGTALYGNETWAANLPQYRSQLISLTRPQCANEIDDDGDTFVDWPADPGCASELDGSELPDQDGDGVDDPLDNCLVVSNTDQRDTNFDGFGNICDRDYDQDGTVGLTDYGIFKASFGRLLGDPAYNPDVDATGTGAVGLLDFGMFKLNFGGVPGPSGLACAGTPPCP